MNYKIFLSLAVATLCILACGPGSKTYGGKAAQFNTQQHAMIMDADTASPMRVFKINSYKDSLLLRKKSAEVIANPNDLVLQHFVKRLYATVRDSMSLGVGIAAPQVGILKNIIWVQRFDKEGYPFECYLNPRILKYTEKKRPCLEGCLSIPKQRDTTQNRSYAIMIEYDQLDGEHRYDMVEDFTSIIFQHEIDHLNGILFLDHLERDRIKN